MVIFVHILNFSLKLFHFHAQDTQKIGRYTTIHLNAFAQKSTMVLHSCIWARRKLNS